MRINQNIMAFDAYRNLAFTETKMGKALEKLSSGKRINRAADDASGLVISQGLSAQIGGLQQAARNAQDGVSVAQTAEGALNEVAAMLVRIRDLAVQASNHGSNDSSARSAAQSEAVQLAGEIDRITSSTRFGSQNLLDGSFGSTVYGASGTSAQLGGGGLVVTAGTNDQFKVTIGSTTVTATVAAGTYTTASGLETAISNALTSALTGAGFAANAVTVTAVDPAGVGYAKVAFQSSAAFTLAAGTNDFLASTGVPTGAAAASGSSATFQVGPQATDTIGVSITAIDTASLGIGTLDLVNNSSAAIGLLDSAIDLVSTTRANLGAVQNRFESVINSLQVATENLSASESRIKDSDMALEMMHFTRDQILQQAGTAMLSQANQVPQSVLKLLGQ
ncbi:MAG TPA: flagellin [Acidimicrobiia bacterium]|nr:flagellin [Acidimicrobiia bacterium]